MPIRIVLLYVKQSGGDFVENAKMLKLLTKGDIDSFEYLVQLYEKKIYVYIYAMIKSRETSKDLTQDVFIKVYKNLYKYNPDYPIKPWIFKIAYNTTINYIKKNKKHLSDVSIDKPSTIVFSKDDSYKIDFKNALYAELNKLKPECRTIVILRLIEDMSFEQIAYMLNSSIASVKLKFYRSRKVLMENLKEYELEG